MSFSFSCLRLSVFNFVVDGCKEGTKLLSQNTYHKYDKYNNQHCYNGYKGYSNELAEAELVNSHDTDAEHDGGQSEANIIDYCQNEGFIGNNEVRKECINK